MENCPVCGVSCTVVTTDMVPSKRYVCYECLIQWNPGCARIDQGSFYEWLPNDSRPHVRPWGDSAMSGIGLGARSQLAIDRDRLLV